MCSQKSPLLKRDRRSSMRLEPRLIWINLSVCVYVGEGCQWSWHEASSKAGPCQYCVPFNLCGRAYLVRTGFEVELIGLDVPVQPVHAIVRRSHSEWGLGPSAARVHTSTAHTGLFCSSPHRLGVRVRRLKFFFVEWVSHNSVYRLELLSYEVCILYSCLCVFVSANA